MFRILATEQTLQRSTLWMEDLIIQNPPSTDCYSGFNFESNKKVSLLAIAIIYAYAMARWQGGDIILLEE